MLRLLFAPTSHSRFLFALAVIGLFLLGENRVWPVPGQAAAPVSLPIVAPREDNAPPCRFDYSVPYHNTRTTCVEVLYDTITVPEAVPNLTGLALDDAGTLYFALTARGEVWAMPDQDSDGFPEQPQRIAAELELPVALAWHSDSLYILTYTSVIRLDAPGTARQRLMTLVSGGSQWASTWPGSIGISPDKRLYISRTAGCAYCATTALAQGMLISYALDGTDERIEASGFQGVLDFAWHPQTGQLWLSDSAPLDLAQDASASPISNDWILLVADDGNPSQATTRMALPYQSAPSGLAFYPYAGFSFWQGDLLVVQRGSWNLPEPVGYVLVVVDFDSQGHLIPAIDVIAPTADADSVYAPYSISQHAMTGQGFFPRHPHDVVVSPNGWIYVSVEEGRILRFRPRPDEPATP